MMKKRLAKKILDNATGFRARWKQRYVRNYACRLIQQIQELPVSERRAAVVAARKPEAIGEAWECADKAYRARWWLPAKARMRRLKKDDPCFDDCSAVAAFDRLCAEHPPA